MILNAAADAGCALLLSEDMRPGFAWRGVTVANPFAAAHFASATDAANAVACGNAYVLKPSEQVPMTQALMWEIMHDVGGLPAGVINLVNGSVDVVIASDLARASHTAAIISEALGVGPVVIEPGLRERHAVDDDAAKAVDGALVHGIGCAAGGVCATAAAGDECCCGAGHQAQHNALVEGVHECPFEVSQGTQQPGLCEWKA